MLSEAIGVTIVGMLVVFLGLVILIFCIQIMTSLFRKNPNKSSAIRNNVEPQENITASATSDSYTHQEQEVDKSVIAAITAAIATLLEPNSKFIVKRIKRANNK